MIGSGKFFIMDSNRKYIKKTKWEKVFSPLTILKLQKFSPFSRKLEDYVDEKKCIFIHIPKAAGMSVVKALYEQNSSLHRSALEVRRKNPKEFNSYYKFSVPRNPIDRYISAYNYLNRGGKSNIDLYWKENFIDQHSNINDFVINGLEECIDSGVEHFLPQVYFCCDENSNILVDDLFKFEKIDSLNRILIEKGLIKEDLPVENSAVNYKTKEVLNSEALTKLQKLYWKDFNLFGYDI